MNLNTSKFNPLGSERVGLVRNSDVKRVVVTGMGVISAIADSVERYTEALKVGKSGVMPLPDIDSTQFRSILAACVEDKPKTAESSPTPDEYIDRATVLTRWALVEALVMAGLSVFPDDNEVSMVMGTTLGGMSTGMDFYRQISLNGRFRFARMTEFAPYRTNDHLMSLYNLQGTSLVLSSACAASTHAIGVASDLIRSGRASTVIAGGFDTLSDLTRSGFGVLGLLSPDRIAPFDRNRNGLVLGEGAGVLVLEERYQALQRGATVMAEIAGSGMSCDAHHMTRPDDTGEGAARAIQAAMHQAGIGVDQLDHINAHGTATKINDRTEIAAMQQAIGAERLATIPITSTKSLIGHTLGAAGALELIATILCLQNDFIHPTINTRDIEYKTDIDLVVNEPRFGEYKTALSNSFGFGGNNGSLIVCVP